MLMLHLVTTKWLTLLALIVTSQALSFWPYQTFITEPTFHPPVLAIQKKPGAEPLSTGLIIFTPANEVPTDLNARELASSMIMTDSGDLIWNEPTTTEPSTNLFVQTLDGDPVLTRWHGRGSNVGHGYGKVTVLDETYSVLYEVCPQLDFVTQDGSTPECYADLHESYITERGTILVTAVNVTRANLASVDGPVDGWIYDDWFYEIDVKTGEVVFRWSALEAGVALELSKTRPASGVAGDGTSQGNPWDWFHMNAVQAVGDKYLVNSRHCWSSFMVDGEGQVEWVIDGSDGGDFSLPAANLFRWQHHARAESVTNSSLQIHYFNNNNTSWDNGSSPSTGLRLQLDLTDKSVSIIQDLHDSSQEIYTDSQGSFWPLENGNTLMGYGSIAKIREYGPSGDPLMTLQFGQDNLVQSFRAYRQVWRAIPAWKPKAAVKDRVVYMSWNGATEVTHWKVYAGVIPAELRLMGTVAKSGFETAFNLTKPVVGFVQVAAYASDQLLRTSTVVAL